MNYFSWLVKANEFVKEYADPAANALQSFSDRVEEVAELVRKLKGGFFADPSDAQVTQTVLSDFEHNLNVAEAKARQVGSAPVGVGFSPADILAYLQIAKALLDWWRSRFQHQQTP